MEEFHNENLDYKDDFIYSYGNAKQGKNPLVNGLYYADMYAVSLRMKEALFCFLKSTLFQEKHTNYGMKLLKFFFFPSFERFFVIM